MIRLYYGQPNDFDRGWTIESLWKPHAKNGRLGGGLMHSGLKSLFCAFMPTNMVPIEPVNVTLSRRSIMQNKFRWFQNISSPNAKIEQFRSPFLWDKNGRRSVYNWTFWAEIFWNQQNIFCIIERRDRVTFTGSISTKFVGINVKNDDFSPECMRPPP